MWTLSKTGPSLASLWSLLVAYYHSDQKPLPRRHDIKDKRGTSRPGFVLDLQISLAGRKPVNTAKEAVIIFEFLRF